jgi:hypothetical protein
MRNLRYAVILLLGCSGFEPSNTDLGLHVEARVSPRIVSLSDPAAQLRILVLVTNSTGRDIIVTTGGPPFSITSDPADSKGLTQSFRIATDDDPINAGPSVDAWGEPLDTIRAQHGEYLEHVILVSEWKAGWTVEPGNFRVRSWYNGREGESAPFTVAP